MDLNTLLTTTLAGTLTIISSIIIYYRFRKYNTRHLKLVSLGIFFLGLLPVSFIPLGILEGGQYNDFTSVSAIFGALFTLTGMIVITWNLTIHQKVEIPKRYLLMLVMYGVAFSQVITGTRVVWHNSEWVIERSVLVRFLMFVGTGWVLLELFRVFILGMKVSTNMWSRLTVALPIGLTLSFTLLVLRDTLNSSIALYQIPTAIAAFIFSIAIIKSPHALIIPNTKIKSITLANRDSGISVLTFPEDIEGRYILNTAAITGITQLISEIAGKDHLPSNLGYADYFIGIYPEEKVFLYSISNGYHPLLNGILSLLAKRWASRINLDNPKISHEMIKQFETEIEDSLTIFLET